jgi:hypothetical protein
MSFATIVAGMTFLKDLGQEARYMNVFRDDKKLVYISECGCITF